MSITVERPPIPKFGVAGVSFTRKSRGFGASSSISTSDSRVLLCSDDEGTPEAGTFRNNEEVSGDD
jgi:hypothetical protein